MVCLAVALSVSSVFAAKAGEAGLSDAPRTWCNPLPLPDMPMGYLCRDNRNGDPFPDGTSWRRRFWESNTAGLTDIRQFREVADPAVLVEGDTWYLYPSCGLMWSSTDSGGTWKHIPVQEKGWYAPAVARFRGKYYLVETGGQPLKVSDSPTGPFKPLGKFRWETFGSDPQMPPPQDPALFADGDRLYLYWGCCSYPKAVWGAELDPDDPTRCRGEAKCLVLWDPKKHPFHDELIEGVWAFRRGDTYYVVYSTYLIVGHMYCMNAVKGSSPLGPFVHQAKNPFLQTPQGVVTGTGHGSVWKDAGGDFWVNYCVEVNAYNGCERMIGQDRIDFDAAGDIVCRTASETPQWLPSSGRKGDTGWKALPLETAMVNAADRSLQTWWTPPELPATAEFRFREPSKIESARVVWREIGLDTLRGVKPGPVRCRVDRRTGGRWQAWIDRSQNDTDLLVDYREGEECTADAVRLVILSAPCGITPAVAEFTVFGTDGADEPPPVPSEVDQWGFRREVAEGVDSSGLVAVPKDAKPWLENRISRCFFGPIKRPPFNRDELLDDVDYYPDSYLAQLRDEGVNGLWLTIEFRDLVETSFNHRHPTAARRLGKLRRTVEKCAKYGIGVWVFAIEPRSGEASPEFYERNKNLFAEAYWPPCDDWIHVMCPSIPETRRYLKEALRDLFAQVPGLKGFMNISHGERWTTCLGPIPSSDSSVQCPQLCPRCSKRKPWEVLKDVLEPMRDGIKESSPDAQFISWFYMAEMDDSRHEWVYDCARHFPAGVTFQFNFESGVALEQAGKRRIGGDYWLSQPGPSGIFRRISDVCRESGTRLSAKIQVSVSHEMATVPYVPAPGLLYRKFKAMRDCGVKDAMYCWYFGCSPGLMNRAAGMLSCEDFADGEDAFLARLAGEDWGEDAPRMVELWKKFSDAYANYPLSNSVQYYGPFHDGVAWELHPDLDLKPLPRSWIRDRAVGDTIGECLEEFSLDDACSLAEKMCAGLEDTADLDALAAKYAGDVRRSREIGVMKAFRILCRSGRDILQFYRARRDAVAASRVRLDNAEAGRHVAEMRRLVEAEKANSSEMLALCERDSRLGFHPEAETYKFHPALLKWRIGRLGRVTARLDEIAASLKSGCLYPLSEFERYAPVFRAERDAGGGIVVEGESSTNDVREIEIDLFDPAGAAYPSTFRVKPENGRFRTVVPAGDWGWIRIVRPGMAPIPAVNEPVPLRLKLGARAVRNCARLVVAEPCETERWQRAIDAASAAGGGTVTVPAGRHVVGSLFLKDNVTLELADGCVLEGMAGIENYRPVDVGYAEVREPWYGLVCAVGATNVAIVGRGEIFGNGGAFLRGLRDGRPRGLLFHRCRGVRLEDVFLHDLASWTCYLKGCDGVAVRRVRVDSHANANNEGIDIDSRNVVVEDCDFDSDDDGIVLKSDDPRVPVENVTVRNCRVRSNCSALKLGTGSHGGFLNVLFENCVCGVSGRATTDPQTGRGEIAQYRVETWPGSTYDPSLLSGIAVECVDGARAEGITFRNISVEAAATPLFIRGGTRYGRAYGAMGVDLCIPMGDARLLKNVTIENVKARATSFTACSITGTSGIRPSGIILRNVEISVPGAGEAGRAEIGRPVPEKESAYPESNMFDGRMLPAYGLYIRHADGVRLENVRIDVRGREVRPEVVADDVTGLVRVPAL